MKNEQKVIFNHLRIQLQEIEQKIIECRKWPNQQKAGAEIKRLQQQAGRIALNFEVNYSYHEKSDIE